MPVPPADALREIGAETLDEIGFARRLCVSLSAIRKPPAGGVSLLIIAAAPGIDVEDAVRCERHVARMAEIVREHGGAEAGRQVMPPLSSAQVSRGFLAAPPPAGPASSIRLTKAAAAKDAVTDSITRPRRSRCKCHAIDHDNAPSSKV